MKFAILLLAFLQLALAQRNIEGFDVLGPIPPTGRTSTEPKYYYVSTGTLASKVWLDAFDDCYLQGGQLATPFTSAQDLALSSYMLKGVPGTEPVWVGAKSSGSGSASYRWLTVNLALTYTNWGTCSIYSNGCMFVSHNSALVWSWCATSCTILQRYVCEI